MPQNIITGLNLGIKSYQPVSGGDINRAYCLTATTSKYFLKINDASRYSGMFRREGEGLNELRAHSKLKIPEVIQFGESGSQQYLLLEWMERGSPKPDFWQQFGNGLANMHKVSQPYFGFETDNYIGSLSQKNTKHGNWAEFYANCRVIPLVKELFDQGSFSRENIDRAEKMCSKLSQLFPEEPSSLLHGDLWSGNYMIGPDGNVVIYDPAVYYGHREMDLGMSLLFGGFDEKFYEAYNETFPLERKWKSRVELTQLYPVLAHAILFGGSYASRAKEIINFYA